LGLSSASEKDLQHWSLERFCCCSALAAGFILILLSLVGLSESYRNYEHFSTAGRVPFWFVLLNILLFLI